MRDPQIKVSVVLTTYNRAEILTTTVDSILGQTLSDFELIISDDCSSDETEAVARSYEVADDRVRYRRNVENLGMPGNLNAAIREARGEFLANLHDGDIYSSDLLERWATALETCPRAAFVFNAYRVLDASGQEVSVFRKALPPCFPGSVLLESLFFRRWLFGSPVWGTVMARRNAYLEAGLFQERFGFSSDVDMWMRLATAQHVAYVDRPLITLPSGDVVPRIGGPRFWTDQRLIQRMFWEGRMRHYRAKPFRRGLEACRHWGFVAFHRSYYGALAVRRKILNVLRKDPPSSMGGVPQL